MKERDFCKNSFEDVTHLMGLGSEALMNIHGHGVKLLERLDRLEQNHDDASAFHRLDRASCKQWEQLTDRRKPAGLLKLVVRLAKRPRHN